MSYLQFPSADVKSMFQTSLILNDLDILGFHVHLLDILNKGTEYGKFKCFYEHGIPWKTSVNIAFETENDEKRFYANLEKAFGVKFEKGHGGMYRVKLAKNESKDYILYDVLIREADGKKRNVILNRYEMLEILLQKDEDICQLLLDMGYRKECMRYGYIPVQISDLYQVMQKIEYWDKAGYDFTCKNESVPKIHLNEKYDACYIYKIKGLGN